MESSSFYDRKEREELYLQLLKLIPKKIKLDAQKILEIGPSDISVKILKREFPNAKYVGLEKQEHFVEKMQREYDEVLTKFCHTTDASVAFPKDIGKDFDVCVDVVSGAVYGGGGFEGVIGNFSKVIKRGGYVAISPIVTTNKQKLKKRQHFLKNIGFSKIHTVWDNAGHFIEGYVAKKD